MKTILILYKTPLFIGLFLMSIMNQIDELEPVFEPEPISFTYNTPAWYILGSIILLVAFYILFVQLKKYKKNRYRRDALKLMDSWNIAITSGNAILVLNNIRILLKQLAIFKYGRLEVASLYGSDWLNFLESKGKDTPFSKYSILIQNDLELDSDIENKTIHELLGISKKWIKSHA